jgi:hypothetical protein
MKERKLLGALMALSLSLAACSDEPTSTSDRSVAPDVERPSMVRVPVRVPLNLPVTGTLTDGGTFEGVVKITEFAFTGGQLTVSGVLSGTATTIGGVSESINQTFTAALATITQQNPNECRILFLDIGPIFLDLLGLQVDLSRIILEITAVRGPGNLLGNLLCALVGLLDDFPLDLGAIADVLADINDLL